MEAILQRYHTPSPASGLASSSSSFDHNSSTNKSSISGQKIACCLCVSCVVSVYFSKISSLFPDSDSVSGQLSRNEEVTPSRDTQTNYGIPAFPAANSDEGLYYQNVLLAVERWFSLFGWLNGPHPISVPHTLRRYAQEFSIFSVHSVYIRMTVWSPTVLLPCISNVCQFISQSTSSVPTESCQRFKSITPVDGLIVSVKIKTPGKYV